MALSDDINLRLEVGLRKLFTDYLDDVSTTYADEDELRANNGQLAVDYAFRGDDLKPFRSISFRWYQGNPKSKDFYYTGGLTISFRLQVTSTVIKPRKGKTGCPVNIY